MIINNKNIILKRFSSGEMKLIKDELLSLAENNKVTILYTMQETIFELFIVCNFFKDYNIEVELILCYLPYQRMDHDNGYEAPTLKYVANIFNCLDLEKIKICEPHCSLEKFNNSSKIDIVGNIYKIVIKQIGFDENKDYLIFTDKGAKQRYSHLGKNHVYFEKSRDKTSGLICSHNMVGTLPKNAKAILIDDIISSGDTIISCLENINNNIYLICGHYEKNKFNTRLFSHEKIKQIYSSNSLFKKNNEKLTLFDIKNLI